LRRSLLQDVKNEFGKPFDAILAISTKKMVEFDSKIKKLYLHHVRTKDLLNAVCGICGAISDGLIGMINPVRDIVHFVHISIAFVRRAACFRPPLDATGLRPWFPAVPATCSVFRMQDVSAESSDTIYKESVELDRRLWSDHVDHIQSRGG
jgi:hypothetical protein